MAEKTPIQKLYDRIPSFKCIEGCYDCCDNRVQFAPEEEERIGKIDYTECSESLCPYVKDGCCSVHENRGLICRLFGSSEMMPCPHGCKPEKLLTEEETKEIVHEYLRLSKAQQRNNNT